ncbi:histone acetylation protein-domain-containing protein [Tribonema minus]|uniref:histone acetyltransferase n=1 Tax=Tribonema minus TaxID=303371 RepID=A0A835ZPS9_9STRA|nr:histone acetylation protein-domain-containing protein [Tribonema minus]
MTNRLMDSVCSMDAMAPKDIVRHMQASNMEPFLQDVALPVVTGLLKWDASNGGNFSAAVGSFQSERPGYAEEVVAPMDLTTVSKRVTAMHYCSAKEFVDDIRRLACTSETISAAAAVAAAEAQQEGEWQARTIAKGLHEQWVVEDQLDADVVRGTLSAAARQALRGNLVVAELSSCMESFAVPAGVREAFAADADGAPIPSTIEYTSRALGLFWRIHGAWVCVFALFAQEYGAQAPACNARQVYISLLDSVAYAHPTPVRTAAYQRVLLGYLALVRERGYVAAHLWSSPPLGRKGYIFRCRPAHMKIPTCDRLRDWYRTVLELGARDGIISEVLNLYEAHFEAMDKKAAIAARTRPAAPSADAVSSSGGSSGSGDARRGDSGGASGGGGSSGGGISGSGSSSGGSNGGGGGGGGGGAGGGGSGGGGGGGGGSGDIDASAHACQPFAPPLFDGGYCLQEFCTTTTAAESVRQLCHAVDTNKDVLFVVRLAPLAAITGGDAAAAARRGGAGVAASTPLAVTCDRNASLARDPLDTPYAFLEACDCLHLQFDSLRHAKYASAALLRHLNLRHAGVLQPQCSTCEAPICSGWGHRCGFCWFQVSYGIATHPPLSAATRQQQQQLPLDGDQPVSSLSKHAANDQGGMKVAKTPKMAMLSSPGSGAGHA